MDPFNPFNPFSPVNPIHSSTPEHPATQGADPDIALWSPATLTQLVGDNPAMHRRLLERFVRNTSEQIPAINAALAASDFKQAGAIAHALKSAARSVGALALGELCQHLETAGKAEDAPACTALSHTLPKAFADAQTLIHQHLAH
jgi:HPt (histidine-containing phosphotransfer) domain-containing protein